MHGAAAKLCRDEPGESPSFADFLSSMVGSGA